MECTIGYRETEPTCRAALLCDWRICPNDPDQARRQPSPEAGCSDLDRVFVSRGLLTALCATAAAVCRKSNAERVATLHRLVKQVDVDTGLCPNESMKRGE
jgi:hypothetical protein